MERQQFTFYRSYWKALKTLPDEDRLFAYDAIADYALNGNAPETQGLVATVFFLIQPTLDTGRKRAENGTNGGKKKANSKQNESKTKANNKQSKSKNDFALTDCQSKNDFASTDCRSEKEEEKEREKEREVEVEKERENECSISLSPPNNAPPQGGNTNFDRFWSVYPKKVGKDAARKAFSRVKAPVEELIAAVDRQKNSLQWQADNGQYIPNPATWLNQGRWQDELPVKEGDFRAHKIDSSDAKKQQDDLERMLEQLRRA